MKIIKTILDWLSNTFDKKPLNILEGSYSGDLNIKTRDETLTCCKHKLLHTTTDHSINTYIVTEPLTSAKHSKKPKRRRAKKGSCGTHL